MASPISTGSLPVVVAIGIVPGAFLVTRAEGCPQRHDDINPEPDELGGDVGQAVVVANHGAVFEGDVLAFDPAPLAEALAERFEKRRRFGRTEPWDLSSSASQAREDAG